MELMVLTVLRRCALYKLHHLLVPACSVRWVDDVRYAAFVALAVVVRARGTVSIFSHVVMVATFFVYGCFNLQ